MKKLILFLLIGALLVLPLSGCFAGNKQNEGTTPNNTTENTTPEVTTPPENDQNDPPVVEGELDKDSELIVELIAYLEQYLVEYDLISVSFSAKINQIKNGAQPLHVAFDPNNYYFVGGYYNNAHKDSVIDYRYASEYVWVGYESEAEIQEYYNGMPCVVVFQINRALTVTNILSDEPANDMEHFQIYKPTFENGANTASPIAFDDTFIYLNNVSNRFDEDIIYHSKSWYYHGNATISCICLDGEYYLPFYLATLEDGEIFDAQQALSTNQITYTLGEYYDEIISVMDTEKYSVEVNEKYTYRYGVVSIDDFVNLIPPDNPAIDVPNYERPQELDEIFTWLEEVEAENDRIRFYIWYEGVEQEYKNKGSHDEYGWTKSFFEVYVCCDYQMAITEPWYPKGSQPDRKTLNSAFYNSCKDKFTDGAYTENSIYEALRFTYDTPEQLLADYEALTSLLKLPYVTALAIHYNFPLPVGIG